MRFIKYLNHNAHNIRYDFSLVCKEEQTDEAEEKQTDE